MDFLQLVFGFVNAPLFATFLLGMFWKRATGHGAFAGLLAGTTAAALTHGLDAGRRQRRLDRLRARTRSHPPWRRTSGSRSSPGPPVSWSPSLVSLLSRPKPESELHNLVYGLTDIPHDPTLPWYKRPAPLAIVVIVALIGLNLLFW